MTLHAALLVLFSALLHPVRDLILKGHPYPESAYLAVTAAWVAIAFAHTVAAGTPLTLPAGTWQLVVASAACLTAYYFGTMAALKTGDLSIYYPIIRSSPLLIVVLSWMAGGAQYAQPVLAGIVLVVLAGFMRLVPRELVRAFPDRIVNIHPSLLPKYGGKGMYGEHVHRAVIAAGEAKSGITIHLVNERYDEGRHLLQVECPVLPNDSPESLATRIHGLEHTHYPAVIDSFVRKAI